MGTVHRVEFELRCDDWRRGKARDIAEEFEEADTETGYDDSVFVTCEIPQAEFRYVPDEWEAYRLARNRVEAKIEFMGWSGVTFSNAEVEKVEREPEHVENPTMADVKNWEEWTEDDRCDWVHEPTNDTLSIREDGPEHSRERWHSEMHAESLPWAIVHDFTVIGRYETEAEARERAVKWMYGNPYSLDPTNSYM